MDSLFDRLLRFLKRGTPPPDELRLHCAFRCECARMVFFQNNRCLGCSSPLGFEPDLGEVRTLAPGPEPGAFRIAGSDRLYRQCANLAGGASCNWLTPADDPCVYCRACRLNRTIPDLSDPDNRRWWPVIERAKRRLVAQLLAFGLPVASKLGEDPERGLMFDFLRSPPGGPRVLTGHASGLITLNVEEADDAKREKIRHELQEPYRTLLGHFRHEVGHYYWDRLVRSSTWLEPYRALFGDERADYAAALRANYKKGPPPDWRDRFMSSYASAHPWEDWAETWAHYLHVFDSLRTALGFGLDLNDLEVEIEPFGRQDLYAPDDPDAERVLALMNGWVGLTMVLNEVARSLGQPDFYPFVLSRPALKKLHFVALVVKGAREAALGVKGARDSAPAVRAAA